MRRFSLLALVAALVLAAPAHASFPGKNGKIAFAGYANGNYDIYSVNADGTGLTRLTTDPALDLDPAWSPDGSKIAFTTSRNEDPACHDTPDQLCNWEIYVMNADGSNQTRLTNDTNPDDDREPAWTPDGTKITYAYTTNCGAFGCNDNFATIYADGSGGVLSGPYPNPGCAENPAWSPNGKLLASERADFCDKPGVYTINSDGSNEKFFCCTSGPPYSVGEAPNWAPDQSAMVFFYAGVSRQNLDETGFRTLASNGSYPAWSPDGAKIVYQGPGSSGDYDIWVMNSDGSGQNRLLSNPGDDLSPDWQPLPINAYPRPKGATPFQTYLTVAYKPCASPNGQHGAPLAVLSCSPPQQASDYLTVGTLDANGQPAKSIGSVRYDVKPGNASTPADVKMTVSIKDVRMKDLSDYPGELQITSSRRITDKLNTPAPDGTTQAATTQDTPFSLTVPCAPTTADTTIGSLCALSTSADAVVPGQVAEGARSNWELGQIKVFDGGADQDADTAGDNTLFMDEGIFVP